MADTACFVGCCERQRYLNCNVFSSFCFFMSDYFCDSVCNYDYCIERLIYCTRMFVTTINLLLLQKEKLT